MKNRTRRWLSLGIKWGIFLALCLVVWFAVKVAYPNVNYAIKEKYFSRRQVETLGKMTKTDYIEDVCDPDTQITKYKVTDLMAGSVEGITYTNGLYILNDRYFVTNEDFSLLLTDTEIPGYGTVTAVPGVGEALGALLAAAEEETGMRFTLGDSHIDGADPQKDTGNDCYLLDYYDTSEHTFGLGVDLLIEGVTHRRYMTSPLAKWLQDNAWRFGFIVRYPFWEGEWTGASFQPWHLHYAGQPHAAYMYKNRMPLEEYTEKVYEDKTYHFMDLVGEDGITRTYVVYRQTAYEGEIYIPDTLGDVEVSFDNTWQYYYVTGVLSETKTPTVQ